MKRNVVNAHAIARTSPPLDSNARETASERCSRKRGGEGGVATASLARQTPPTATWNGFTRRSCVSAPSWRRIRRRRARRGARVRGDARRPPAAARGRFAAYEEATAVKRGGAPTRAPTRVPTWVPMRVPTRVPMMANARIAHVAALDAELARVDVRRETPRRGRHTPRCYREVAETIEPTTRRG